MIQEHVSRRLSWLGYGACAMAGCLWGTGFFFGKLALREMSVGHMVLYRFLFASLGMLPMVWTARRGAAERIKRRWTRREIGTAAFVGAGSSDSVSAAV
jgi:drug/metabolite transporter (DMT)-like permease